MNRLTVTIAAEPAGVRLLARRQERDVLRAVLGPAEQAHPGALTTLLEGLRLWHPGRLSVVLCADERADGSALELWDALGVGGPSGPFDVGVAFHPARLRRGSGLGDFRDLRRLSVAEGAS